MTPETALALLLALTSAPETPSTSTPGVSEVESTASLLNDWADNGGDVWSFTTYDGVTTMRSIAAEYALTVSAEDFEQGSPPLEVAEMVNTLAGRLEPFCTE